MKFVFKLLNDRLKIEENDLIVWKEILITSSSEDSKRQANGNIQSTEHRIVELIKAIDLIK